VVAQAQAVARAINRLVAIQLERPRSAVRLSARFIEDLGADSLSLVRLALSIEERFEIDLSQKDIEQIRTVADLVRYVCERTKPKGA
jgi:acyl carrier protein